MKLNIPQLNKKACQIRRDVVEMVWRAGSGHIGGALSMVEIVLVLYHHILNVDARDPDWPDRDRLVLSKGHAAASLYAILADLAFFDRKLLFEEFIRVNGRLSEHPDMRMIPGIDMSTGSLGQGISSAVGMAWAARYTNKPSMIYAILGCGEQQEGQVWEAAMAASHHNLDNLTAIIDLNNTQVSGNTSDVLSPYPLVEKYRAFGWGVDEVDGHNIGDLITALSKKPPADKPRAVIATTTKGKGISCMEGNYTFHATSLSKQQYGQALEELNMQEMSI